MIFCLVGSIYAGAIKIDKENNEILNKTINANSSWTLMIYLDGDNNLESSAIDDFLEMSAVGSTENVNIVVQFDRVDGYDYSFGDWTSCKRFHILKDMVPTPENAIMDIGEANMGDPQELIDFATWSMSNFPAEKYCLILWDHGSGWKLSNKNGRKDICEDITNYDVLKLYELKNALSEITSDSSFKIDLLGFDACLMGEIEVAYELKNFCNFFTASENTEPADGWNYEDSLADLIDNYENTDGEKLGEYFVTHYEGYQITLSTIDVSNLNALTDAISNLASALSSSEYIDKVLNVFSNVEKYMESCDIYHFAQLISENIYDYAIQQYSEEVKNEIEYTVTSEKHDSYNENSHGLSIYLPDCTYDHEYDSLDFSTNGLWDDFLIYIFEGATSSNPPTIPIINGISEGEAGTTHRYTFQSSDPEGDDIYYVIDWNDGSQHEIIGPKATGVEIEAYHVWYDQGGYVLRAKAVDSNGAASSWSTFNIMMPRIKNSFRDSLKLPFLRNIFEIFNIGEDF